MKASWLAAVALCAFGLFGAGCGGTTPVDGPDGGSGGGMGTGGGGMGTGGGGVGTGGGGVGTGGGGMGTDGGDLGTDGGDLGTDGGQSDGGDASDAGSQADAGEATDGGTSTDAGVDAGLPVTPALTAADATLVEGTGGSSNATFVVSLSEATTADVSVNYATANGTATASVDYAAANGTLTFAAGETQKTVTVQVTGDATDEVDETFTLSLSSPAGATLARAQATGTITDDDAEPELSITDVLTSEGTGTAPKTFAFRLRLSAASEKTVTVAYATSSDAATATAGVDYVAAAGTLTFVPGETEKLLSVNVTADNVIEPDESFFVNLSTPMNATLARVFGIGLIQNDDALSGTPSLSITDATIAEGNSGTSTATFTVSLSQMSAQTVTVSYATSDGTATAGSDYVATQGTLTFAPGESTRTISVTVNGDLNTEADEGFFVYLTNATNATIATNRGVGTINNDDAAPALSIADLAVVEGSVGVTVANFAVTLSAPAGQVVTVQYATQAGTATSGRDYQAASGTLSFAAGETVKTISVNVSGDVLFEANETFTVNLTTPQNATLAKGQGTGTIQNDDAQPVLSIAPAASLVEGNAGLQSVQLRVTMTGVSEASVTVQYTTADGTATAGSDYAPTSGTLTFPQGGASSQLLAVTINGDTLDEPNETFTMTLSNAQGAALGVAAGTATIQNDDSPLPTLTLQDVTGTEGNTGTRQTVVSVKLSRAVNQTVTVQYATADNTALSGTDYVAATGTLTFAPFVTQQSISIVVNGDTLDEPNESFFVNLSNPSSNAFLGDPSAEAFIQNDDSPVVMAVQGPAPLDEGNVGTKTATFTVSLSAASGRTVRAYYGTVDGTAVASGLTSAGGADYAPASGTLTFAPGETSRLVSVTLNGDALNEANETFRLTLSNLSGAVSPAGGTVIDTTAAIRNDDPPPSVSIGDVTRPEGQTGEVTPFSFTVTLSAPSAQDVTVQWSTQGSTASGFSDYTGVPSNAPVLVLVPAGQTSATVSVNVLGDNAAEADEVFFVNLTNPMGATLGDGQGVGTIVNDD